MLSHFELSELMQDIKAEASAAELHGFLCGQLCVSVVPDEELWQEFIDTGSEDDDLVYDVYNDVRKMIEDISEELKLDNFGFQLLLPDDEFELAERAQALSEWCHGFLNGFGVSKEHDDPDTSDSSQEVLNDFTKICRLGIDVEFDAKDEEAFMELAEYVRMAAITVFEEMSSQLIAGEKPEILH